MKNKHNINLFWYGIKSKFKGAIGAGILVMGLILSFFISINNSTLGTITGFTSLGIGIYFMVTAKAERFDFKKQAGHIIYNGGRV